MSYTILIVEDDQRIASVVRFHLERESFECHHAADGDKGLSLYNELHPDLVILDVMLPGRSGFDVCQAIRSSGGTQPARVVSWLPQGMNACCSSCWPRVLASSSKGWVKR